MPRLSLTTPDDWTHLLPLHHPLILGITPFQNQPHSRTFLSHNRTLPTIYIRSNHSSHPLPSRPYLSSRPNQHRLTSTFTMKRLSSPTPPPHRPSKHPLRSVGQSSFSSILGRTPPNSQAYKHAHTATHRHSGPSAPLRPRPSFKEALTKGQPSSHRTSNSDLPARRTTTTTSSAQEIPAAFKPVLSSFDLQRLLRWLPMPPDPSNPLWHSCCFDCFGYGHLGGGACKGEIVCRRCLVQGHPKATCHLNAFDDRKNAAATRPP